MFEHKKWYDIQIFHPFFYYYTPSQMAYNNKISTLKFTQIGRLLAASRFSPQKHVSTTLVGIPVVIYTLVGMMCLTSSLR